MRAIRRHKGAALCVSHPFPPGCCLRALLSRAPVPRVFQVVLLVVVLGLAAAIPVPEPGGWGKKHHTHYIIHVPYHVHTVHHHHVKKVHVPVYIKEHHHEEHHHEEHHPWGWD
ncbi:Protein CTLA-2-alpha [Frankliniella fusca]|uniref:Protein CTLA-2-alpha n=1 Tax=Frankliniella fusca TaxID=407009 RepID=A0AAE1GRR0_9NEOP|nr:Protein CTLA-2-alpha [Frankliniella fusca]